MNATATAIELTVLNESVRADDAISSDSEIRRLRSEVQRLRHEVERLEDYKKLAYRDHVTGLHNRRSFDERLHEECAKATRSGSYTFAVVMVDVDDFKTINDTHGHAVGDQVLFAVGRFLRANIREVDLCFRVGGDEFALLLPATPESGSEILAHRLLEKLGATDIGIGFGVTLSLGAVASPPNDPSPEALMAAADSQMYLRKRARKANRQSA